MPDFTAFLAWEKEKMVCRKYPCRLALLLIGFISGLFASNSWAMPTGQEVFTKKCATCHDLPNPSSSPTEGWVEIMEMMAPMAGLSDAEKSAVIEYLQSQTSEPPVAKPK
jgi:mono/diheme cytochrome c family protein